MQHRLEKQSPNLKVIAFKLPEDQLQQIKSLCDQGFYPSQYPAYGPAPSFPRRRCDCGENTRRTELSAACRLSALSSGRQD